MAFHPARDVIRRAKIALGVNALSIDASAREVITEVGNILLNACLGTFGNLLKATTSGDF